MMPLALSRRPGQTRHDIPQSLFSPFLSLYRINSLRTLMRKDHCDCILIILGLDSKFCDGAHQTASYLLFDIFESRESDILKSKVDMEVFEDVIICIKRNETHIYCNAVNYMLFLPYITSWPNLRIHCITEGEMKNVDSYEESKILAFKNITQNCKFIFLPYNDIHVNAEGNFNKMMIEDWPIVQSYAFDCKTQSSHEFFTLSREVVDISNDVGRLAKQMDPVHIEESLVRSLLAFTGTLEAVYRLMDTYTDLKTQSLKASPIEPLLSIYQHATFAVKNSPRLLPPYLLYGKEASKSNILSADMKFKVTENVHSMEFDHAIIRGYAQPSGLVCERTLFFQQSHHTVELPLTTKPHFNRLTRIYTELLSVLWSVMDEWQKNTHVSLDKILLQVQSLLTHKLQCEQFRDLEIKSTYPWQNPTDPVTMVVLSGAVYDILDEDGTSLGSLVAADTWIISTLRVNQSVISRKAINLTGGVQHVCIWTRSSSSLDLTLFDTNRKLPVMNEQMDLVFPLPGSPVCLPVTCACFEDRIVLHGKRIGTSWFKLERILHYRPVDLEKPEILEFVLPHTDTKGYFLSVAVQPSVLPGSRMFIANSTANLDESDQPNQPSVQDRSIWLILKSRTKAKRLFLEQIAPIWRDRGLLTQPDHSPTQLVIETALKSLCLHRDGQNVLSDLVRDNAGRPSPNYHMKFSSLDQLMTHQPTAEAWIEAHRVELRHIEASWCLKASNEFVTTPTDYMLRCGVYLTAGKYIAFKDQSACTTLLQNLLLEQSPNNQEGLMSWTGKSVRETNASPTEPTLQTSRLTEPLVLTVICGTIGSRKEAVMRNLVQLVTEETEWIQITPLSISDLLSSLNTALKELGSLTQVESVKTKRIRGVLLCPGACGSREVLAVLMQLPSIQFNGQLLPPMRIGCVVTCVDVRTAVMDAGRMTFPGLLDLLAEGWTNYLLHTGPPKAKQVAATKLGVPIEEIELLLHSVNPRLSQLYAPDGHTDQGHVLEALLDEEAFDDSTLQRARLLSYPNLISSPAGPRMHTVTLRFMRPVDRVRFTNCLKALCTNLKPWPFYGNVYSVNGQLSFIGEPDKLYDVFHITLSGVSRIICNLSNTDGPKTKSTKPFWLTGILAAPPKEDKVFDEKLSNQFANWLRQAAPQQEGVKPLLRLSDLTSQDLEKIHERYHLHSLPPGWFYTGAYYVNMNGEKSFQHPNFDAFVKEYLEGENTKIAARNARITSHPIPDLFSDPS